MTFVIVLYCHNAKPIKSYRDQYVYLTRVGRYRKLYLFTRVFSKFTIPLKFVTYVKFEWLAAPTSAKPVLSWRIPSLPPLGDLGLEYTVSFKISIQ